MKYGIYIGQKYSNIYDFNQDKYVTFFDTPFGIYDEINGSLSLDKFVRFILENLTKIEKGSELVLGLENINEINTKYIPISFQKAGLYRNIKEAKEKISFELVDKKINYDDVYNDNIAKSLSFTVHKVGSHATNHSYGLYDANEDDIFEVIPINTSFEDLIFNKKNSINYKYYVDVEQINNDKNQFILTIAEDNIERLYIYYEDKRLSGKYRVYFYVRNGYICIDIYDLVRNEWISTDDTLEDRQFEMRK